MGAFVDSLKRHKREKVQALPAAIVTETVREFSDSLVRQWSPYGDPALWKAPPPADYVPGNFRSSWFLSIGQASTATTTTTDHDQEPWNMDKLDDYRVGNRVFLSNSAPHAGALEACHSTQAPLGIMINSHEFENIALGVARGLTR
jgi:hypothetical protein